MTSTGLAGVGIPDSRSARWSAGRVAWLGVLGTYAACVVLYATAKHHHFFYFDEWIYIENADRDRLEHLLSPYFWYFHPISWRVYFVSLFRLFGPSPAAFLVAQVILLWVAAFGVHLLLVRITRRHALGFVANLLYIGATATATDAYWKSCIAYPVAACFEVAFLALVLEIVLARGAWPRLAGLTIVAALAYSCAWMSRNNAIVLPFALVALWSAGRSRRSNAALVALIGIAIASLAWYRLDLAPGSVGSADVARTYRLSNVAASWVSTIFGPPWRVDAELLSFIPGMRWGYPSFTLSKVLAGRVLVLGAVLASLGSLRRTGNPRERFTAYLFVVTAVQLTTATPFVHDTPQVDRVLYEPAISLSIALALTLHRVARAVATVLGRGVGPSAWAAVPRGAAIAGGIGLWLMARHMAGFGGADEFNTRRWECMWRQFQDIEYRVRFGPIVLDREPSGTARDDVTQFLAMSRLFWRPGGVGGARIGDLAPDEPETLRVYGGGRIFYVGVRPVRPDRSWTGPGECPLPVRSVPIAIVPQPARDHADDALALPRPEILESYASVPAATLRRGMNHGTWRERFLSTSFLGLRGAAELPALERALDSDRWYVREAAAQAISRMDEAAIPTVRDLVSSRSPRSRELGARILTELTIHDPAALDQIARWLGHADPWVRGAAMSSWERSRSASPAP